MLAAADHLGAMNMTERDVIGGREAIGREGVEGTDIDFTHRVAFAGADGGEWPLAMIGNARSPRRSQAC